MSWFSSEPLEPFYPDEKTPITLEDYHLLREQMYEELEKLKLSGWEEVDQGFEGVSFAKKVVEGYPVEMLRIESEVDGTPEEVSNFHDSCTEEERKEFDKQLRLQEVIEDKGDVKIIYAIFNGMYPVASRDFVAFRSTKVLPDGTWINLGHTINYAAKPIQKDDVRAKGKVAIYHRPVPDPMGNIPRYFLSLAHTHVAKSQFVLGKLLNRKFGGRDPSLLPPPQLNEPSIQEDVESDEFGSFEECGDEFFIINENNEFTTTQEINEKDVINQKVKDLSNIANDINTKINSKKEDKNISSSELLVISNTLAGLQKSINDMQQQLTVIKSPPKNSVLKVKKGYLSNPLFIFGWPIFIVLAYHLFKKRFLKMLK